MSRAIQIRVSESLARTIHVEDGIAAQLELLPVLSPARMAELLGAELAAQGFTRDGSRATRTDAGGLVTTVDLEAATVAVTLGADQHLEASVALEARVIEERAGETEGRLRGAAHDELARRIAASAEQLRREVTAALEHELRDLRDELDGAIGRATIAALTERAKELGEIEELVADGAGNVTIKVKL